MDPLDELNKALDGGRWKKAVRKADEILNACPFGDEPDGRQRFSFMNKESFVLYSVRHGEEPLWLKNHANVAFCKAYALTELGDLAQAEKTLLFCLRLDPVSVKIKTELFSVYVRLRDFEAAGSILCAAEGDILSPGEAAAVYAKKGYLFSQRKDYENAKRFCLTSLLYEENNAAVRELRYLESVTGEELLPVEESDCVCAARLLHGRGELPLLPEENTEALRYLRGLYTAAGQIETARIYEERLCEFDRIRELILC